jgi:hypothetical protein
MLRRLGLWLTILLGVLLIRFCVVSSETVDVYSLVMSPTVVTGGSALVVEEGDLETVEDVVEQEEMTFSEFLFFCLYYFGSAYLLVMIVYTYKEHKKDKNRVIGGDLKDAKLK